MERSRFATVLLDLKASVVVFLVAMPLGLGIAMASGYPPVAGLITSMIGGLVVGLFSGAPLQVSGAAAGLTMVAFELVRLHGFEKMAAIVMLAGFLQIAFGLLRTGQWFRLVSPTVVQGLLSAVGLMIVCSQFHGMFDRPSQGSLWANLKALPSTLGGLFSGQGLGAFYPPLLAALVITIMLTWYRLPGRLARAFPPILVAIASASLLASYLQWPMAKVQLPEHLLSAAVLFSREQLAFFSQLAIWGAALKLALIASAESLLSAVAVDHMRADHHTQTNRELAAQGVGNALCGFLGVLPMTGVIIRSATNVHAGAQTRLATILHGLWCLVAVTSLPWLLEAIPTSALAAVLVCTGIKLINGREILTLAKRGLGELCIYATTVSLILAYDILVGVSGGVLLAVLKRTLTPLFIRKLDNEHQEV